MAENFRNNRERQTFARQKRYKRTGLPRVLIVTEGEVTEVTYFDAMCRHYGLVPIKVNSIGEGMCIEGEECGSAPISVYQYAFGEFKRKEETIGKAKKAPDYWDEIYCVFDRDNHPTYQEAILKISELQAKHPKRKFKAITSHRCFELWFLLHFEYTTKNFSSADALGKELRKIEHEGKKLFHDYTHGCTDIFSRIHPLTKVAIERSIQLNQWATANHEHLKDAPHTLVGELVQHIHYIANLKSNLGLHTSNSNFKQASHGNVV